MNTHSTFPIIEEVNRSFYLPQNGNRRHIYVLLPHNYHEQQSKRYPVLYIHDAQNLFGHGPFGSWDIDRSMAALSLRGMGELIIVAINHAVEFRIEEFMPYKHNDISGHGGKTYAEFVSVELKQYIDKTYRTLPGRLHTGMGGSSMGGLITIYSGIMFSHIFSKLMIFSPSLWAAPKIYFDAAKYLTPKPADIYLYAGGSESKYMVKNVTKFKDSLEKAGSKSDALSFKLSIDIIGQHNEARWGQEFPRAVEWLYFRQKI